MHRKSYRFLGLLCITAHLNLILMPISPVQAVTPDDLLSERSRIPSRAVSHPKGSNYGSLRALFNRTGRRLAAALILPIVKGQPSLHLNTSQADFSDQCLVIKPTTPQPIPMYVTGAAPGQILWVQLFADPELVKETTLPNILSGYEGIFPDINDQLLSFSMVFSQAPVGSLTCGASTEDPHMSFVVMPSPIKTALQPTPSLDIFLSDYTPSSASKPAPETESDDTSYIITAAFFGGSIGLSCLLLSLRCAFYKYKRSQEYHAFLQEFPLEDLPSDLTVDGIIGTMNSIKDRSPEFSSYDGWIKYLGAYIDRLLIALVETEQNDALEIGVAAQLRLQELKREQGTRENGDIFGPTHFSNHLGLLSDEITLHLIKKLGGDLTFSWPLSLALKKGLNLKTIIRSSDLFCMYGALNIEEHEEYLMSRWREHQYQKLFREIDWDITPENLRTLITTLVRESERIEKGSNDKKNAWLDKLKEFVPQIESTLRESDDLRYSYELADTVEEMIEKILSKQEEEFQSIELLVDDKDFLRDVVTSLRSHLIEKFSAELQAEEPARQQRALDALPEDTQAEHHQKLIELLNNLKGNVPLHLWKQVLMKLPSSHAEHKGLGHFAICMEANESYTGTSGNKKDRLYSAMKTLVPIVLECVEAQEYMRNWTQNYVRETLELAWNAPLPKELTFLPKTTIEVDCFFMALELDEIKRTREQP